MKKSLIGILAFLAMLGLLAGCDAGSGIHNSSDAQLAAKIISQGANDGYDVYFSQMAGLTVLPKILASYSKAFGSGGIDCTLNGSTYTVTFDNYVITDGSTGYSLSGSLDFTLTAGDIGDTLSITSSNLRIEGGSISDTISMEYSCWIDTSMQGIVSFDCSGQINGYSFSNSFEIGVAIPT